MVFTAIVRKTGHVTKYFAEIDNSSATCTTNLWQIYNKSFSHTANRQQIDFVLDLLYRKSTTNLRLIGQMEFEY